MAEMDAAARHDVAGLEDVNTGVFPLFWTAY